MKRFVTLSLLVLAMMGWAGPARACSCALAEPQELLKGSPAAFIGTLTAQRTTNVQGRSVFLFDVEAVYAGDIGREVAVYSAGDSAACGLSSPVGQRLAVFASLNGSDLESNLCSIADVDQTTSQLGSGAPPSATGTIGVPPDIERPTRVDWQGVGLAVGGLALVGGVWLITRQRARAV
ncbi:MAG TPA: hypothetical protein VID03_07300 [Acidimicrobiia bacterium]|jgi:hypothetical protein